ncbi:MAG: archaellin/type IV pilin N-terminal domain-containing protein, partial [Candidatus Heimdallarchaeaceae archaeon]
MKLPSFGKSKRAISPVLATVMLISLVVAASAMV